MGIVVIYFVVFFIILGLEKGVNSNNVDLARYFNLKKKICFSCKQLDYYTLRFFQFFFSSCYYNFDFLRDNLIHYRLPISQFFWITDAYFPTSKVFFFMPGVHRNFFKFLHFFFILRLFGYFYRFTIRGKGYKFRFFKKCSKNFLVFKFGFSHRIFFFLPSKKNLIVGGNKRFDFFFTNNHKLFLAQLVIKILLCGIPDVYKSKGLCFYSAVLRLKTGKVR